MMHPQTKRQLEHLLLMLKEKGEEETFSYIRALLFREKMLRWKKWLKGLRNGRFSL